MKLQPAFTILLATLLPATLALAEQEASGFVPPERKSFTEYESFAERNPFGLQTEAAEEVTNPDFAKHLYISGMFDYQGETTVYITNRNENVTFSVSKSTPHEDITLEDVKVGDNIGSSSATIKKGGAQLAQLSFDQALTAGPITNESPGAPEIANRGAAKTRQQATNNRNANSERKVQRPRRVIRRIRPPNNNNSSTKRR